MFAPAVYAEMIAAKVEFVKLIRLDQLLTEQGWYVQHSFIEPGGS